MVVRAADVLGVLEGAPLDCELCDDAIRGRANASRVEVVLRGFTALVRDRDARLAGEFILKGASCGVCLVAECEDNMTDGTWSSPYFARAARASLAGTRMEAPKLWTRVTSFWTAARQP